MADTVIGTGSDQAVERWSARLTREAIGRTWISRLMGTSNRSCVQRHQDLSAQAGENIRFDLLMQLVGYGKFGDAALVGNEQAMIYHQHSLLVDQIREAVSFRGMSQQRTLHNMRQNAVDNLADFFARVLDEFIFAILTGFTGLDAGGGATPLETAMDNFGGTSDHNTPVLAEWTYDKSGGATMSVDFLTALRERAKKPPTPLGAYVLSIIRPIRVEAGEEVYVAVINPYQATGLKTEAGSNKWREIAAQALPRSWSNPIWTGAIGKWDGNVVHESIYLPIDATTATPKSYGLHLGAQAGHIGFGQPYSRLTRPRDRGPSREFFTYFDDITDYGNKTGTGGASILGMARSIYNGADYGVQVLITDDAATA